MAGNFSTGKIYQIKEGSSNHAGFLNAFYTSICTAALFLVINGMKLEESFDAFETDFDNCENIILK